MRPLRGVCRACPDRDGEDIEVIAAPESAARVNSERRVRFVIVWPLRAERNLEDAGVRRGQLRGQVDLERRARLPELQRVPEPQQLHSAHRAMLATRGAPER